jgi:hypothetical protein
MRVNNMILATESVYRTATVYKDGIYRQKKQQKNPDIGRGFLCNIVFPRYLSKIIFLAWLLVSVTKR